MKKKAEIYYARLDEFWTKEQKYDYLNNTGHIYNVEWQKIDPNDQDVWLTDGLDNDFDTLISIGDKKTKLKSFDEAKTIFHKYSRGVSTGRDAWAYNFNSNRLTTNVIKMLETYNYELVRYQDNIDNIKNIDNFVNNDSTKISWDSTLKNDLKKLTKLQFYQSCIRESIYRPFSKSNLYFNKNLNNSVYLLPIIFPTSESEQENLIICVAGIGNRKDFGCLISNHITSFDLAFEKTQCFPYYIYDKDGSNRRENITDYALQHFREFYQDETITKWEIFYYVYGILHHPEYRRKYAANLKRELPRIPLIQTPLTPLEKEGIREISKIGESLAKIQVNYEQQPEYPLKMIENPDIPVDLRVKKMKLSKDKTQLIYNDYLTLTGIPAQTWEYKLGNRSALDWIIDQYQIKKDKRSGIVNDPNQLDDEMYIVGLIKKIITVSVETVKLVKELELIVLNSSQED